MQSLAQYAILLARVDQFAAAVRERFPDQLACRRGCEACCTHIGIMTVEALALARAVAELPPEQAAALRTRAHALRAGAACPLLDQGACRLYAARPVICRTQGLPLLVSEAEGQRVDYCPLNFQGVDSLPGDVVLNLETLNQALAAINLLCRRELASRGIILPERMAIADALLLDPVP